MSFSPKKRDWSRGKIGKDIKKFPIDKKQQYTDSRNSKSPKQCLKRKKSQYSDTACIRPKTKPRF